MAIWVFIQKREKKQKQYIKETGLPAEQVARVRVKDKEATSAGQAIESKVF